MIDIDNSHSRKCYCYCPVLLLTLVTGLTLGIIDAGIFPSAPINGIVPFVVPVFLFDAVPKLSPDILRFIVASVASLLAYST